MFIPRERALAPNAAPCGSLDGEPAVLAAQYRRRGNIDAEDGREHLDLRGDDDAPSPPAVCAAVFVVPVSLLRAEEAERRPVNRVADQPDPLTRAEVEAKAVQAVMDRERALGSELVDVSSEDRGYEIESRDPASGRLRFIEVKGRRADARIVSNTQNEMLAAFNAAESFILAVVLVDGAFVHPPLSPEPGADLRFGTKVQPGVASHLRGGDRARGEGRMTEPRDGGNATGTAPVAAAHRRRNNEGRAMATIRGDT